MDVKTIVLILKSVKYSQGKCFWAVFLHNSPSDANVEPLTLSLKSFEHFSYSL